MTVKAKKWIINLAKALVSALIIWIVFQKIDPKQILQIFGQINPIYLIGAGAMFVVSKILSAVRLNYFLKDIDVYLSETYNLKLYWLGMYYNLFLPGGIGGDGYKIYHLKQQFNTSAKNLLSAILLDRVTGVLALFVLTILLSYGVKTPLPLIHWVWVLIPVSIVGFYVTLRTFFKAFAKAYNQTSLLSFGVQISQLVSAFLLLLALHQQADYCAYLFLFLLSSVVAVIPFTIGGMGARELTFLLGAQWLHLNSSIAVAISLLFFIITAIVSFGGIYYSFVPIRK
jgi:glycosyltransferase 2 family protein